MIGQVTIDILPDDVLLVIFDYYVAKADEDGNFEEWQKLVHVSKLAICCIWVATSPESPNSLLRGNTCEGEAGCLATVAYS